MFSNTIIINNGAYNVSYNFNESADTLEFLVEASATGWVGFGFSLNADPDNMVGYDVAVGGVLSNGTGYLRVSEEFGLFKLLAKVKMSLSFNDFRRFSHDGRHLKCGDF